MAKDRKPKNKIESGNFGLKGWLDPKGICDFEIEIKNKLRKKLLKNFLNGLLN